MLSAGISALTDKVNASFVTAYLLPAGVAILGGLGIAAHLLGVAGLARGVANLGGVGQSLAALLALLATLLVAFVLRALTRTIVATFAGDLLPAALAGFLRHGQQRAAAKDAAKPVPADPEALAPTALGNVLAGAAEYPRQVYAMDGVFWWARLTPLLPPEFTEQLAGAQAPMMSLLNLSLVFVMLGLGAVIGVGLLGRQSGVALAWLIGGFVLARLCYGAAVRQAGEVGSLIRVAFDLYRQAILQQLGVEPPGDLAKEQALWQQLTQARQAAARRAAAVIGDAPPG
jgi:hypothetical protein